MAQTHYQTLQIHEDASEEVIKLAYQRLLVEAKEKLQDSPAYFTKEKKLKDAFQLLSNPALRQAYDLKLAAERSDDQKHSTFVTYDDSTSSGFFKNLVCSKGFIISLSLVVLYFFGIRMNSNKIIEQHLIDQKNVYEQQKMLSTIAAEKAMQNIQSSRLKTEEYYQKSQQKQKEKRMERWRLQEKQRLDRIARQERSRIKQLEKQAEYEQLRKARATEKRLEREREQRLQEEYEAKRRLRETIQQIDRTSKLERMNNTIKSN